MRNIFGRKSTRFERGDAVRLKTAIPNEKLESGMVGTVSEVRRAKLPSYDVQFINTSGVVGRFTVDETDLMPADGRRFDDNDVVRLRRDVPSEGLSIGKVGIVSEVSSGPPIQYVVEFVDASGATIARTTLVDEDVVSPDEAPERPDATENEAASGEGALGTGLADDELDNLIEELRSQGQTMQQQSAEREAAPTPVEPTADAPSPGVPAPVEPAEEPPVETRNTSQEPPSDGRRTRFVRGEAVRLDVDLISDGIEAGTEGTVTWAMLGPPVAYLVEFRDANGGTRPATKVEETYLSFSG